MARSRAWCSASVMWVSMWMRPLGGKGGGSADRRRALPAWRHGCGTPTAHKGALGQLVGPGTVPHPDVPQDQDLCPKEPDPTAQLPRAATPWPGSHPEQPQAGAQKRGSLC